MVFESESAYFAEVVSGFMVVGAALWVAVALLMRVYDRKQAQLERMDMMKTELLGDVSHEMKTPVAVISGYAQTLRNELNGVPGTADAAQKSRMIIAEAERLSLLISQILDTSRIDEGHMSMIMREVSVIEIIQDTMNSYGSALGGGGNRFELCLDENLPQVTADSAHISRVLVNLLSNAARHTKNGTITVSAAAEKDAVAITVTDTGEGIAREALPYIFDRYSSGSVGDEAKKNRAASGTGTGLGLYICKYIVEAHGGEITAKNEPGGGTSFRFTLPVRT